MSLIDGLNPLYTGLGMSPIVEITEEVKKTGVDKEFERRGKSFLWFQRGDFGEKSAPPFLVENIKRALDEGYTRYPISGGEPLLKQAIIEDFEKRGMYDITKDGIIVTNGGQEALQLLFGLFNGSDVVSPKPTIWSCMIDNQIPYSGGNLVTVPFTDEGRQDFDRLDVTLGRLENPLLYIASPDNPSGRVTSFEDLMTMNRICLINGVGMISDEAYTGIVYGGGVYDSALQLSGGGNIFVARSFSKEFKAPGLRIGCIVTRNKDRDITAALARAQYTQAAGVSTHTQIGLAYSLRDERREEFSKGFVSELENRKDAMYNGLVKILGKDNVPLPGGGLYVYPDFSEFVPSKEKKNPLYITNMLMREFGMLAIPGSAFGDTNLGRERFSYAQATVEQIDDGMERLRNGF